VPVFGEVGAPEPTGPFKVVSGFVLAKEVEEVAQDAVEVEPRDMALVDDPATSWDDRVVAGPSHFAFGDQGIYNVAVVLAMVPNTLTPPNGGPAIEFGDFPANNAEHRDAHMLAIDLQAFGFGSTNDLPDNFIQHALPDVISRYDAMPDTDHPVTPEPATSTPEQARMALVKFLLALTDARVKFERAPFDRPEIFVPIDGTAPDNIGGRQGYLADARFMHVPARGAAGRFNPLSNFLGVSSIPVMGANNDHFDPNPTLDCVIIDNRDPGTRSVGTWRVSDGTNPWGPDSVYSLSAGDTFTFGTDLPGAQYGIYMRWTKTPPSGIRSGHTHSPPAHRCK